MTAFGNFAPIDQGTADNQSGKLPADIGLGVKGNSSLVDQAWAFSPANFVKQSGTSDLPTTGYGSGARARLDDAILQNFSNSLYPPGPYSLGGPFIAAAPSATEGKTLRSILPAAGYNGRAADATTSNRPSDRIDALSSSKSAEAKLPTPLPTNPFTVAAPATAVERTLPTNFTAPGTAERTLPTNFTTPAIAERTVPTNFTAPAKTETGPLPVVARVEAPATNAVPMDIKAHPLFANLNKDAKTASPYHFNARMDNTASLEALSRKIMSADFSPPRAWPLVGTAPVKGDPFAADNCYQSMEFRPDGTVATTTTLPDLSASKIESAFADKSKSVALTDHLGRPTVEQRFDGTGQLVSHTTSRFDHPAAPMVASNKIVQTATQTIETKTNESGTVIASKIMPYSELNKTKSIA